MAISRVEKRTENGISLPAFICWLNCYSVRKRETQINPSPLRILAHQPENGNDFGPFRDRIFGFIVPILTLLFAW